MPDSRYARLNLGNRSKTPPTIVAIIAIICSAG
jgi:hypothetical protein